MPKATKSTQQQAAHTPQLVYLLSDVNIEKPSTGDSNVRTFDCIANSGKPFVYFGQRTIVDLTDIKSVPVTPALVNHDRDQVAGFGSCSVQNNQLTMSGTLVTNDPACKGDYVANLADKGFVWQMSAHIEAEQVDELPLNKTATVNGQEITGPIFILRDCRVVEVSFTPTGVDYETSAVVLSATGKATTDKPLTSTSTQSKDNTMTLEEALAEIEKHKAAQAEKDSRIKALEEENAKLKASEAQANVDAQLSQAGFTKSDDGKWQGVSDTTYQVLLSQTADNAKAMIGDLKLSQPNHATPAKPNLPNVLLGEQYPNANGGNGNQGQGVQLSNSPLVADALARVKEPAKYI